MFSVIDNNDNVREVSRISKIKPHIHRPTGTENPAIAANGNEILQAVSEAGEKKLARFLVGRKITAYVILKVDIGYYFFLIEFLRTICQTRDLFHIL